MKRMYWHIAVGVLALVVSPLRSFAQEFRATISGAVTDPSGAAVPDAKVTITEVRTGTKSQTVSDKTGQYVVPFLAPGIYEVDVQANGFKNFARKAITLASDDHPIIDVQLAVGSNVETMNVVEDVPIVDTANSSTGQTVTTQQVEEFPLNGRNPMMLTQLAMGVIATGTPSLVHPFDNGAAAAWSIGGTPSQTSEILLDGSPNATWDNRLAYSPQQDAVQEVRVKAFDSDAAYGHAGGGTINMVMKTGTNNFHGSLYGFTQPPSMTADSFFSGGAPPGAKLNQYGATVGGPVLLPKLWNGRNKLFWFFAYEGLNDAQANADFATVPTDAERHGDFSALLKVDPTDQIYDPKTGATDPTGKFATRQPFQNNIIPQIRLNPVALAFLNFYPEPNTPGQSNGFQNYLSNIPTKDGYNNELGRLDYNMSTRSRLSFDVRHNHEFQTKNTYFGNVSTGSNLLRENWGGSLDEVYTLNTTTVIEAHANFTRLNEIHTEPSAGFDSTTLGFPSYINSSSEHLAMPFLSFGSCGSQTSFQCLGDNGASVLPSQSFQLFGDVVKIVGNHTLKFGTDLRQYRLNTVLFNNSTGSYTFSTSWVNGPNTNSKVAKSTFGQDFASFLLGLPTSGQYDISTHGTFISHYYAGFIQDDWRVRRNLTLNLGLRFDHDSPYSETHGKAVNGFASTVASPIAAAAIAAYNNNPIPQIPAGGFAVPGGLTFATPDNSAIYQNTSHWVSPRVGFAWTPDVLKGSTVLRGGFGMFVQPLTVANLALNGNYSSNPILDQEGFSQTTPLLVSSSFFTSTGATTLDDPFNPSKGGIRQPVGSANGLSTFLGQSVTFLAPQMQNPYSLRWTLGVQHEITPNLLLEVAYIGNHAVHLPVSVTQLNAIPRQFLSTESTYDQTLQNLIILYDNTQVTNPFAGLISGTNLNNKTTTVAQLLSRYPQFAIGEGSTASGVIEQNATIGLSSFHSLNVRVEKRLSHGLSLIGTYMFSKLIEQDSWLNDTDSHLEKRISPFDHPQHFVTAVNYELPFGKGKAVSFQSNWSNTAFGGWHLVGVYSYQTGAPIVWNNSDYVYLGGNLNLDNRLPHLAKTDPPAFDVTQFNVNSNQQFKYHIRTFPTTFSPLRVDGINNFDTSILKRFDVRESTYLELRFEAFNVLNHPTFAAPNVTPTSSAFGEITAQANRSRTIQAGARFVF